MLIALTILWLTGGAAGNMWLFPVDFSDRVETVVSDDARQTAVSDLFDEIVDHYADYNKRVKEIAEEARSLNADYDADETAFEPVIESLLNKRKELQTAVLDARMKMVGQVDEKEWQLLFAADSVLNKN